MDKILYSDPKSKRTTFIGSVNGEQSLLVADLQNLSTAEFTKIEKVAENGIYHQLIGESKNKVKLVLISPCTQKHIDKYSAPRFEMITETPKLYAEVVKPLAQEDNVEWISDILNGKSEQEDILLRNSEFVLMPDMKWNRNVDELYLLVITTERILSLRELRREHLPLLQSIRTQVNDLCESMYGLGRNKIRMYVHYQPTYYHFHVHVVHVNCDLVGQSHLLDDIIQNIELVPDYYQKVTLNYSLNTNLKLFKCISGINE